MSLVCNECDNYGTFFTAPSFHKHDCLNTSNYNAVECANGTRFCLSAHGMIFGGSSTNDDSDTNSNNDSPTIYETGQPLMQKKIGSSDFEAFITYNFTSLLDFFLIGIFERKMSTISSVGTQRGCFNADAVKMFTLRKWSFLASGGCETGDKHVTVPASTAIPGSPAGGDMSSMISSTNVTYTFSGVYCLCRGDRCNDDTLDLERSLAPLSSPVSSPLLSLTVAFTLLSFTVLWWSIIDDTTL